MNMRRWGSNVVRVILRVGLLGAALPFATFSAAADETLEEQFVVPVDPATKAIGSLAEFIKRDLQKYGQQPASKPAAQITRDWHWIVVGDLFKTNTTFALVELPATAESAAGDATMACAEYAGGDWHIRGLWRLPVVWRPEGWKESEADYLPVKPSTHPFILKDLSGDGVPEVIVAGEVEKYFQGYYLLRFDPKSRGMRLLAYSMAQPELVGPFVRLYEKSPRLAIWGRWEYYRWAGESLVFRASWHYEVPYSEPENSFTEVKVRANSGKESTFRIFDEGSSVPNGNTVKILRDGAPYATVAVTWEKDLVDDEALNAWLFERLTGLSRDLFPLQPDNSAPAWLASPKEVDVKGSAEAQRRFGPR